MYITVLQINESMNVQINRVTMIDFLYITELWDIILLNCSSTNYILSHWMHSHISTILITCINHVGSSLGSGFLKCFTFSSKSTNLSHLNSTWCKILLTGLQTVLQTLQVLVHVHPQESKILYKFSQIWERPDQCIGLSSHTGHFFWSI